jgi:adenylate cyclase
LTSNIGDGWSTAIDQDKARAEKLLLEAFERDPNNSFAHYAMGQLRRFQNRLPEAKIEYETAIALDRNNAWALRHLGTTLMFLGQPDAGIPFLERAIRLNPHDPNTASMYWGLGTCHLFLGDIDEAVDLLRKGHASNPRLYWLDNFLAGALGLRGDIDEAKAVLAEALQLKPEVNSLARYRAKFPWGNAQYWALHEKTVNVGLRRAGFPDE